MQPIDDRLTWTMVGTLVPVIRRHREGYPGKHRPLIKLSSAHCKDAILGRPESSSVKKKGLVPTLAAAAVFSLEAIMGQCTTRATARRLCSSGLAICDDYLVYLLQELHSVHARYLRLGQPLFFCISARHTRLNYALGTGTIAVCMSDACPQKLVWMTSAASTRLTLTS
jgi:hypothetical protein